MRILNCHSGIGGNRKEWGNCHQITAVDYNNGVAEVYQNLYPDDKMIIGDVYEHLENNYLDYDFIWLSPRCVTHGQYRHNVGVLAKGYKPLIPDMTGLYGAIVFLQTYAKCKWVVENTIPYYEPLIPPTKKIQRHLFWSNFEIGNIEVPATRLRTKNKIADLEEYHGVSLDGCKIKNKRQVLRNCTNSAIGKHILDCAIKGMVNE